MTDQHRATPEQWDSTEKMQHPVQVAPGITTGGKDQAVANCILELRARVEALEATQHAHMPASGLNDEQTQATMAMIEMARGVVSPLTQWRPIPPEMRPAAPAPTGSLVERVALTRMNRPLDEDDLSQARAAIREVAAWLDEWNESVIQEARDSQPIPDPCGPSDDLTAGEAIDRLRDEANR